MADNRQEREEDWKLGIHRSSNGKTTDISELPVPYLKNIINKYGGDHDVTPIQEELDRRPPEEEK